MQGSGINVFMSVLENENLKPKIKNYIEPFINYVKKARKEIERR